MFVPDIIYLLSLSDEPQSGGVLVFFLYGATARVTPGLAGLVGDRSAVWLAEIAEYFHEISEGYLSEPSN